jgi:hypothetical protein
VGEYSECGTPLALALKSPDATFGRCDYGTDSLRSQRYSRRAPILRAERLDGKKTRTRFSTSDAKQSHAGEPLVRGDN